MIDFHMHTSLCGHARGTMEEYVQHAVEIGLDEMGFSCHFPYPEAFKNPPPDCSIPADKFQGYLDEVRRLQRKYAGRIAIRLGSEFDYLGPELSYHPLEVARKLGLDFCLASVHLVDGVIVDHTPDELRRRLAGYDGGLDRLYERYWELVLEISKPGWCTTLAHLDLFKKFSNEPDLRVSNKRYELIEKVLDSAAASGIALEINTSGWDKPCEEQYPSEEILRRAVERGVMITAGSDAHAPGEVGRKFGRLKELLGRLGIKELVRFEGLEAKQYSIK